MKTNFLPRTFPIVVVLIAATIGITVQAAPAKKAAAPAFTPITEIKEFTYKKFADGDLKLFVHYPKDWKATDQRAGMVFFFGGGWRNGSPNQFLQQADYLATRGMVTVRADYRVASRQKATPDQCVEDAKGAIRWVRSHAKELGIDPNRIVGAGGSAGGHLAACAFMADGFEGSAEDLKISSKPNLLVLFNPALDLVDLNVAVKTTAGADVTKQISPNELIKPGVPATVMFFGTEDKMVVHAREYVKKSKAAGNRAELYVAEGQAHGFFNRAPWTEATVRQADEFLISVGYLKGKPTMKVRDGAVLKEDKGI